MGLIIYLVQVSYNNCGCKKDEDDEYEKYNICDPDYDGLIKQDEPLDGLEVYRVKNASQYSISANNIRCPLCTYHFPKGEEENFQTVINKSKEKQILNLIDNYHSLMKNVMEVDIFKRLTNYNNEIIELSKEVDKNRYYKHTCKRCDFQEIYIDICIHTKGFNYKSLINKCYVYDNWANNPQLKNELLKRRKEVYDEELRIRELNRKYRENLDNKEAIEARYKNDFNSECFEKEKYEYNQGESYIDRQKYDYENKKREWEEEERRAKDEWERERERKKEESERIIREKEMNGEQVNSDDYYDYNNDQFVFDKPPVEFDYKSIWEEITKNVKYTETKRRLWEYLKLKSDKTLYDNDVDIYMSNEEREEFLDYVHDHDDDYRVVCKYLNTHKYPLYNEITDRIYIYN